MKTAKRSISVLLLLCILVSMIPSALAANSSMPFTDVRSSDWFYSAVQYVYDNGMMSGTGATTFSPNATTTRGMIVTILHRLEKTPKAAGTAFSDVPANQYYADAVAWASSNNIVSGYGNGKFGPNDAITREQMAAILYRYAQYKKDKVKETADLSSFSDSSKVSAYAVDAMKWAVGKGLISGTGNNQLSPTGSATRAQVAMILARFCGADSKTNNSNQKNEETPTNKESSTSISLQDGQKMVDLISIVGKMTKNGTTQKEVKALLSSLDWISYVSETPDGGISCLTNFGVSAVWSPENQGYLSAVSSNTQSISYSQNISLASTQNTNGYEIDSICILCPYYSSDSNFNIDGYSYIANTLSDQTNCKVTLLTDESVSLDTLKHLWRYDMVWFYSHGALSNMFNSAWDIVNTDPYTMTGEFATVPAAYVFLSEDFLTSRTIVNLADGRIGVGGKFYEKYYSSTELDGTFFHFGSCNSMKTDSLANGLLSRGAEWVEGWTNSVYFNNDYMQLVVTISNLLEGETAPTSIANADTYVKENYDFWQQDCRLRGMGNNNYSIQCNSLNQDISGKVVDAASQKPLSDVRVSVTETNSNASPVTAKTDYFGNFSLSAEKDRLYTITFLKEGYQSTSQNIILAKDTALGTIELAPVSATTADKNSISGVVVNKDTGKTVGGVTVKYWSEMHPLECETVTTDASGRFTFRNKTVADDWWSLHIADTTFYYYDPSDNPTAEGYQTFNTFCGELYIRTGLGYDMAVDELVAIE